MTTSFNTMVLSRYDLIRGHENDDINQLNFNSFMFNNIRDIQQPDIIIFCDNITNSCRILKNRFGSASLSDKEMMEELSEITRFKMYHFGRWLGNCYDGELNNNSGIWLIKRLKDFNEKVFPMILRTEIENNTFNDTLKVINDEYV